ncbi:hypothetical protein [Paenibacillus sp. J2TS4]|uniref:hypothetical protein n=1 Tax=Paenibacillus sp. J2TS4 TaxID=2807194 RepID=UPI001B115725|nr:hypothetical protein [Paenibacillus sp. J2TS4]GIP35126.1 hypothetical protein J2TS4_43360 [Paenibacillus sp. J2TS4]
MRKRKWKKWIIGTAAVLIIVAVGGYFAMDYAVDRILKSITAGLEIEGTPSTTEPQSTPTPDPSSADLEEKGEGVPGDSLDPSGQAGNKTSPNPTGESNPSEEEKNSVSDGQSKPPSPASPAPQGSPKVDASISQEKAAQAQEQITIKDKTKVTSVLLKRLNSSDIKTVMELASGGMSVEEKREAKKIILEKLTEEEYNELIAIAAKLGLSQGKSYEDSQKQLAP